MSFNIIVKNYEHINRSLPNWDTTQGKYVSNRQQYDRLIKENNLVPFEEAEEIRKSKSVTSKPEPSPETIEFLESVQRRTNKQTGKVKLTGRQIDYMVKKGAIKDRDILADKLPSAYQPEGGFR